MRTAPVSRILKKALAPALGIALMWALSASDIEAAKSRGKKPALTPTPTATLTPTATAKPDKKSKGSSRKGGKARKEKKAEPTPTRTPEPVTKGGETEERGKGGDDGERPEPEMGLSVAEISKRVDEAQASMKDVRMELKMDMKDALSGTKQKVRGVVLMKNPGRVFAHYTHPVEQFLYVKKDLVQMYQPDQGMVYRQKAQAGKRGEPVYLGVGHELKQYMAVSRVSVVKESAEEVTLLFVPKDADALFERMKVTINKRTWWPYKIEMESPSVETKAEFGKFEFNRGVEDSMFEFTPPDDAQIVEGAVF